MSVILTDKPQSLDLTVEEQASYIRRVFLKATEGKTNDKKIKEKQEVIDSLLKRLSTRPCYNLEYLYNILNEMEAFLAYKDLNIKPELVVALIFQRYTDPRSVNAAANSIEVAKLFHSELWASKEFSLKVKEILDVTLTLAPCTNADTNIFRDLQFYRLGDTWEGFYRHQRLVFEERLMHVLSKQEYFKVQLAIFTRLKHMTMGRLFYHDYYHNKYGERARKNCEVYCRILQDFISLLNESPTTNVKFPNLILNS